EARAAVRESRPREQLGRAEPLRPLRRLADGLLRHLDVARPAPGLAEPEEEVDALGLVGRLIGGQQIERGLVLPRALLVGELGERAIGRAQRRRSEPGCSRPTGSGDAARSPRARSAGRRPSSPRAPPAPRGAPPPPGGGPPRRRRRGSPPSRDRRRRPGPPAARAPRSS